MPIRHSSENSARSWPFAPSSTKIASSPAFSVALIGSGFACSARKTIDALSGRRDAWRRHLHEIDDVVDRHRAPRLRRGGRSDHQQDDNRCGDAAAGEHAGLQAAKIVALIITGWTKTSKPSFSERAARRL